MNIEDALTAAEKSGGLVRFVPSLGPGEFQERRLWLRPPTARLLESRALELDQRERLRALFRRFVLGKKVTVVTAQCRHREVAAIGDIKELKTQPPPLRRSSS